MECISRHSIGKRVGGDEGEMKASVQTDQMCSPLWQIIFFCDRMIVQALEDLLQKLVAFANVVGDLQMLADIYFSWSD